MTHLERFIELYKEVGIELDAVSVDEHEDNDGRTVPAGYVLRIENDMYHPKTDKIGGYCWFFTEIYFDVNGNFVRQSFWE